MTHLNDPVLALAIKERGLDAEPDFEIGANEAGEITMNVDGTEITADEMANIKDATKVVANPEGEATGDMNKIQVGETIYNVAGGGGSGLPAVTQADAGKTLVVDDSGEWTVDFLPSDLDTLMNEEF